MKPKNIRTRTLTYQGYTPKAKSGFTSRFYKVFQYRRQIRITFGKIGTAGRTIRKVFPSGNAASDFFNAKLLEKILEGYQIA